MNPNLNTQPICRSYQSDFQLDGNKVLGLAAVVESRTNIGNLFIEVIERGAFDATDLTDVLFFVNHDMSKIPLARSRRNNGNSTMLLNVDERGLNMEATLDIEHNTDARALVSAIKRNDITGMSFLFTVKEDSWENLNSDLPTRRIKRIGRVREVSAVNFPAYEETEIHARTNDSLECERQALDNARAQGVDTQQRCEMWRLRNAILAKK
ncbi:MAG: HK97 family phage prohead protease [Erysipelotrichaceae bacterium]|nr:HK97 family phage prohead protease [Erysipelotrichaceae bacterium]